MVWEPASFLILAAESGEKIDNVRANGDSPHPEKSLRDGSPRPCNSLYSLKGRSCVDKLVLNASTRCNSRSNIVVQFGVRRAKIVLF